jgi:hypothetical protein
MIPDALRCVDAFIQRLYKSNPNPVLSGIHPIGISRKEAAR